MSFWTKEKEEEFTKLYEDGVSLLDIREEINYPYSLIGLGRKKERMGLKRKEKEYIPNRDKSKKKNNYEIILADNDVDIEKVKEELIRNWNLDWKPSKSTKESKKKNYKSYLVICDIHIPYYNKEAMNSIFKIMEDNVFDGFIILGDFMDMTPISHWLHDQKKRKSLENLRMKKDYIVANMILDEFDKRLPKDCDKRFFYGNHECWEQDMVEKYPVLENMLNPAIELKLKERGYKVYDKVNHIERIGRLSFTHGIYTTANYVKKHIDEFKTNVIFGHIHSIRDRLESSPAKEIAVAGYSVGCLCDLNPDFMKNRPNKWSHGFAVVNFYDNGFFDIDNKRIIKGKVIYNGKFYKGKK